MAHMRDDQYAVESYWWLAGMGLVAFLVLTDIVTQHQINGVYGAGAVLTAVFCGPSRTGVVAATALVASVGSGIWNDNLGDRDWAVRFAACALLCAVAVLTAVVSRRRRHDLRRTTPWPSECWTPWPSS